MSQLQDAKKLIAKLRQDLPKLVGDGVTFGITQMAPVYQKRIFVDGKTSAGSRIGSYSKKPMYASLTLKKKLKGQAKTSGLKPLGQAGTDKFKNGNKRKSMYLKDGYAGLRRVLGRQNQKVDFNLTGALSSSIKTGKANGRTVYGFTNSDKAELADNLETKYKKPIFKPSRIEEETAVKEASGYINRGIDRILAVI